MNTKVEEFLDAIKLGEFLNRQNKEQEKNNKCMLSIIVFGSIAIVAILAYTIYKLKSPCLKNHRQAYDDFDFSFDNDYASDDED